jgi:hypothetical protein
MAVAKSVPPGFAMATAGTLDLPRNFRGARAIGWDEIQSVEEASR